MRKNLLSILTSGNVVQRRKLESSGIPAANGASHWEATRDAASSHSSDHGATRYEIYLYFPPSPDWFSSLAASISRSRKQARPQRPPRFRINRSTAAFNLSRTSQLRLQAPTAPNQSRRLTPLSRRLTPLSRRLMERSRKAPVKKTERRPDFAQGSACPIVGWAELGERVAEPAFKT